MFEAPRMVYSVLGAVGPRAAAAPVALSIRNGVSPVKQATTRLKFARPASVSGTCLQIEQHEEPNKPQKNSCRNRAFVLLVRIKGQNA